MELIFKVLVVLVCDQNESFRKSFKLEKILSWKFGFIHFLPLMKELEQDGLIQLTLIDGINHIKVTKFGSEFLDKNFDWFRLESLKTFPKEKHLLQDLFDKYLENRKQI